MLFWISLIILAAGIGIVIWNYKCDYYSDFGEFGGPIITVIGVIAVVICMVFLSSHIGVDGYIAKNQERYEMLTYQYENNMYDNDNDVGKRELVLDIQDWNEDLAWYREVQDDFWIGIFIPNIFDQFEFISLTPNVIE